MEVEATLIAVLPLALSSTLTKRSITCLEVGSTATATWTDSDGETCSFAAVVGSNHGSRGDGFRVYACNGQCGAGCSGTAIGNVYTQDCFSHDICSYFTDASGCLRGRLCSDPNCDAYDAAVNDMVEVMRQSVRS